MSSSMLYIPSFPFTRFLSSSWPHVDDSLIINERYTRLSTLNLNEKKKKKKTKIANFILNLREWGRSPNFSFHISLPQIPLSEIHILLPLFNSGLYEKFQLFLEYFPKHHFYHDVLLAPFSVSLTCFIFFVALIST